MSIDPASLRVEVRCCAGAAVLFSFMVRYRKLRNASLAFFPHLLGAAADLNDSFCGLCNLSNAKEDHSSTTWCLHNLPENLFFCHAVCLGPREFAGIFTSSALLLNILI